MCVCVCGCVDKKKKIFSEKQKGFRDACLSYSTPQKSDETRGNVQKLWSVCMEIGS